jgi:hypothetical protein
MNIDITTRRIWNKKWVEQSSQSELMVGTIGWFGVLFCVGMLIGMLLV